jgi:hypothetical protein
MYRVSKNAISGPNALTGFWIQYVEASSLMPEGPAFRRKCSPPAPDDGDAVLGHRVGDAAGAGGMGPLTPSRPARRRHSGQGVGTAPTG